MRRTGFLVLLVLCLGVAGYAVVVYGFTPLGERLHPDMRTVFQAHPVGILTHVFAASLALLLGPFQFMSGLRARRPTLHRWSGRLYLGVGVGLGGSAGLFMATHAFGGWPAQLGFGLLALGWLGSGALAYAAVRRGDLASHRRWMVRNFALTCAAVTLRLYLPAAFVMRVPMELSYPVIAWACWLPNLAVAEWILLRPAPTLTPQRRAGR